MSREAAALLESSRKVIAKAERVARHGLERAKQDPESAWSSRHPAAMWRFFEAGTALARSTLEILIKDLHLCRTCSTADPESIHLGSRLVNCSDCRRRNRERRR